jgi:hypothetical protein
MHGVILQEMKLRIFQCVKFPAIRNGFFIVNGYGNLSNTNLLSKLQGKPKGNENPITEYYGR